MFIKVRRARRGERPCKYEKCPTHIIEKDELYYQTRAKIHPGFYLSHSFHLVCFLAWSVENWRKPKRLKKKSERACGRPELFVVVPVLEQEMWKPNRIKLTSEQKKMRKVLTAKFHRAKKKGKDTSAIKSEMDKIGGVPNNWSKPPISPEKRELERVVEPKELE